MELPLVLAKDDYISLTWITMRRVLDEHKRNKDVP